jgi:hypothetical protein
MHETAALDDHPFLRAILNLAIPPQGPMPGAGDLDLWPTVAAALSRNPAAWASLTAALEAVRTAALARDPGGLASLPAAAALEVVQSASADHPALMPTIARATALAYYQHPSVLIALGEPPRPPFPEGFDLEPISPEWLAILQRRAQSAPGSSS